jgi:hypothetical protein
MRSRIPARARPDEFATPVARPLGPPEHPAAEDVLGEIGLVLVVILGAVLAINAILVSLNITP